MHATDEIKQNVDEMITKDEPSFDSGKKENVKSQNENTNTMADTKSTYIISKFKKFFKS